MENTLTNNENGQLYIVTRAHNLDYISSTVYLTQATSESEAIINCMEYEDLGIDGEEKYAAELARLRSLSLYELEQDDRDNGNVWEAQIFTMPTVNRNTPVVQIAKLDTD
jgi:hypothetical protein